MEIKVEDIFNNPEINGLKLIAGESGLNRSVKAISILDAPDGYKWLKGGEFVVTTAYMVKDNIDELFDLIVNINKAGASAFGIKIDRYINKLPDEIIKIADKLNLPIISIPNEISYSELIHMITLEMFDLQTRRLYISEKIHNSFTQIAIQGGKTQEIIDALFDLINKDICFYDNFFDKLFYNANSEKFEEDINQLSIEQLLGKYNSKKIEVKNNKYGYLIFSNNNSDNRIENFEEIAIEHAMMVLILDIQKRISNYEIQTKYRDKLIQDLIFNNINSIEEVNKRASIYNWKFNKPITAVVVDIDNFKEKYLETHDFEIIDQSLKLIRKKILSICKLVFEDFESFVYTTFSDKFVFLIQCDENDKKLYKKIMNLSDSARDRIREKMDFSVTIGIGMRKDSVINVHESFDESLKAVKLGRKMYNEDSTIFYDDLRVYRLLDSIKDKECIEEFYLRYLDRLIKYDKLNSSDFLCTLECLSKSDWNMNEAAQRMFIHYNTMKYRVKRISEILNLDIKDPKQKLNIELAFKLYNLYK